MKLLTIQEALDNLQAGKQVQFCYNSFSAWLPLTLNSRFDMLSLIDVRFRLAQEIELPPKQAIEVDEGRKNNGWVELVENPKYDIPVLLCNIHEYQDVVIGKLRPKKYLPFTLQHLVDDAYFEIQNNSNNQLERIADIGDFTHYMYIIEPKE